MITTIIYIRDFMDEILCIQLDKMDYAIKEEMFAIADSFATNYKKQDELDSNNTNHKKKIRIPEPNNN